MQEKVYVDTSSLILLNKIDALDLLNKIYGNIYITSFIKSEFDEPLPAWVIVESFTSLENNFLNSFNLGIGESSIITNAIKYKAFLIIDDLKARKVAETLNLKFTGCIGILIIAKEKGLIISVRFYLEKIQQTNFRISMQLIKNALELAKEK